MRTLIHLNVFVVILTVFLFAGCGGGDEGSSSVSKSSKKASTHSSPPDRPFDLVDLGASTGLTGRLRSGTLEQKYIVDVKSTGVGLLDFDGDGLLDVVLTAGSTVDRARRGEPGYGTRLFRNLGDLRFEDVTERAGIPPTGWASAPVAGDYDGDGRTDLLITQFGRNILLHNEGGRFKDVTATAGFTGDDWSTSAVFHDLDGDGDLDLYVCNYLDFPLDDPPRQGKPGFQNCLWKGMEVMCGPKGLPPSQDRCFENLGEGRFKEVTHDWGLDVGAAFGLGVVAGDFDGDGSPELYVANDGMPNFLFDRNAQGRFEDVAYFLGVSCSEGGAPQAGMGVDAADLNGDGIQDLVCTNFSGEENNLYLSQGGQAVYVESSSFAGTALAARDLLGWGVGLRDFDLDGRIDLFVADGHVYPQAARPGTGTDYPQWNLYFAGEGDGRFRRLTGDDLSALGVKKVSRGAAFGDLDNDGDVDIVVANLNDVVSLIENRLDRAALRRHFVGLRLVGAGSLRDAVGARVTVATATQRQSLEVRRQASFQASNDPRLVFGLGESTAVTACTVHWPDGREEEFAVKVDAYNVLRYGEGVK
ncbi:MAG TPA: CRTAC1 family protein [Planctomycetes bacterium]|nr:CRTAC1 family protein [Planctomycetota bacterium]